MWLLCAQFFIVETDLDCQWPHSVTGHLSEGSFVRNVIVRIPKFDAKPNPNRNQWCSPRDQRLEDKKWKSWYWSWITKKSWNWSWSWTFLVLVSILKKKSCSFKTFVVILDGSVQGTPWHFHYCERQKKQFAIRKPLFERTYCASSTLASAEWVNLFNNGGYLLGHTDASKAQCIGKQTVHGLKCYLEKCHKDIYTL